MKVLWTLGVRRKDPAAEIWALSLLQTFLLMSFSIHSTHTVKLDTICNLKEREFYNKVIVELHSVEITQQRQINLNYFSNTFKYSFNF